MVLQGHLLQIPIQYSAFGGGVGLECSVTGSLKVTGSFKVTGWKVSLLKLRHIAINFNISVWLT